MNWKSHNCIYIICLASFIFMPDVMAIDERQILEDVISAKYAQRETQKNPLIKKALEECSKASKSDSKAVAFYIKSFKKFEFLGGTGKNAVEFKEWERKNRDRLRDKEFHAAVRLHLVYFCISLRKASGVGNSELLDDLIAYTDAVNAASEATREYGIMNIHLNNGIFAKCYGVSGFLSQLKWTEWEPMPVKIHLIGEKVIFPELLRHNDMRMVEYIDKCVKQENERLVKARDSIGLAKFNQIRKPELLWRKAEALLRVGQRKQGLEEMHMIIKEWPTHPKINTWLDRLQSAITNPQPGTVFR